MGESLHTLLRDALLREFSVRFAYLVGSWARGTPRPDSDVDVAAWLDAHSGDLSEVALGLQDRLCTATRRAVDLIVLNCASLLVREQVRREGDLLLERDPGARLGFESLTLQQALDFEPIRRQCAAGLLQRIEQEEQRRHGLPSQPAHGQAGGEEAHRGG